MRVTMMGVSPRIPVSDWERTVRRSIAAGVGLFYGAPKSDKRRVRHMLRLAGRFVNDETLKFSMTEHGDLIELFIYNKEAKSIGWWGDFNPDLKSVA